ncbi:MAG: pentapeptide repeat-containing protein [Phycisphaerae bacterium]|nr:pentapeptide repeat-containing protein [Phycisphaerae bacterium]
MPFLYLDWLAQWATYGLSHVSFFELLEYCGSLSILVAVVFYFLEAPQRTKMKHYQAWQVINSAEGKGGNGGRIEALHELNEDGVSLLGVDVSDAFLQGVDLHGADLTRALLSGADMRSANLSGASLRSAKLHYTNLNDAVLVGADVDDADLSDTDLTGADLRGLTHWQSILSLTDASVVNVRNAPDGFLAWAKQHGAIDNDATAGTATTKR